MKNYKKYDNILKQKRKYDVGVIMLNLLIANLSATIDIVALILIIIFALYGLMEGFSKTLFKFFGTIIALVLAIILSSTITKYLQETLNIVSNMAKNISSPLSNLFGKELMQTKLADVSTQSLGVAGISGIFVKIILSVKNKGNFNSEATVSDVLCPTIAYYIVLIISVVVLFILLKILFKFIGKIVKKAYKNKSVATLDRVLGLALSVLYIVIVIEVATSIVGVLPFSFAQNLYASIQASKVIGVIQDINLLGFFTNKIVNAHIVGTIVEIIKI